MRKTDSRIDAYIEKAAPFAQPVLHHLRQLIHEGNPDVEETVKWGMPSFDYKGPYCSFASFKQHSVFGFWKAKLLDDPNGYLGERYNQGGDAMGNLGRITGLQDLPPDEVLLDFVRQAKKLNDDGVKMPAAPKKEKKEIEAPEEFLSLLKKNKKAQETFENFSPSHKREYLEWITGAKTEATRNKRMASAIELMNEGKSLNWKYK